MTAYGPHERSLLESGAAALYEEILGSGGLAADDARIAEGGPDEVAFALLRELGLVLLEEQGVTWMPEDPAAVQSQVVTPLSQQGAAMLEESSQWARAFGTLSQSWRRSPLSQARGPFTYLRGEAIDRFIAGMVADAEEELLTAQPQTDRGAAALAAATERDTAMLERGTKMRTLYQHAARRSTFTHDYVAAVSSLGAEVRTLDEFFKRLIIVDRRIAVIPASTDHRSAMVVREPSVIDFLLDIFERSWERARPFTNRETTVMRDIAAEQRAMSIRMMIEGHSDSVSAKRLGVSPRTFAGYIADLKTEYEAETRFQLGYVIGQRGVSGEEADPGRAQTSDGSDG